MWSARHFGGERSAEQPLCPVALTTSAPEAGDPANDAVSFQRFLDGENDAFLALFRKYNQRLFVYCLKILGNREQAEDTTQEMWERIIQLRRAPQQVRNPGGLFLRVARNLCIDHLRARRPTVPLEDLNEEALTGLAPREPTEREEVALMMLDKLPFEYREVLILNLYCGYRFDEIAAMTGKTPDAIWARASRARAQLRTMVSTAFGRDANTPGTQLKNKTNQASEDRR